mgnify:CR=1 FL=1
MRRARDDGGTAGTKEIRGRGWMDSGEIKENGTKEREREREREIEREREREEERWRRNRGC